MFSLENYRKVVGDKIVGNIYNSTLKLLNKHILHINSTYHGGGVAQILHSMIILLNDAGIETGWRILQGDSDFFNVTKNFHNALQSEEVEFSQEMAVTYEHNNEKFAKFTHIDHDAVVIHDPQPLALLKFFRKKQPWIWRCHIDLTAPQANVWDYLKDFLLKYDYVIISSEKYKRDDIPCPTKIIHPSIDPLNNKNRALCDETIKNYLKDFNIPTDKPIISQISRFDKWKDPKGVLQVFEEVKKKVDCRLIFCYNMASDDPEGVEVYHEVKQKARDLLDNEDVIFMLGEDQLLVNVIQRISDVVLQKSLKEGFGLTVAESMWKGTAVVASNVGGIPIQIEDGEDGILVDPTDIKACAEIVVKLLKDEKLRETIGTKAREKVRNNFLITRHITDYINLFNEILT